MPGLRTDDTYVLRNIGCCLSACCCATHPQERIAELEGMLTSERTRHQRDLTARLRALKAKHDDEVERVRSLHELQQTTVRAHAEREFNEEILKNNQRLSEQLQVRDLCSYGD